MGHNKDKPINEELIRFAGEAGAKAALEAMEKERQRAVRERRDRRLRNTKLLLRNYRELKNHCTSAVYEASQIGGILDLTELMEDRYSNEETFVESIKRSAQRTSIIMSHVDEMLKLYELYCTHSTKPEDSRRFRTLYSLYLSDDPMSVDEISMREDIDPRTVYKDIDTATEKLTSLLFGIDAINAS